MYMCIFLHKYQHLDGVELHFSKNKIKVLNPKAHCVKTILKMSISKAFKSICPKGCTKIAHKSSEKLPKKSTKELQKNRPKNPKTIPKKNLPKILPKKSPQKSPNITKSTSSTRSMRDYKNSLTSLLEVIRITLNNTKYD